MAAVVGARLAKHLQSTLEITNTLYWTDSQIVLYWLSSTKQLKPFISNRVKEIKDLTSASVWNYCHTSSNPADLLTRGITADILKTLVIWRSGTPWLSTWSAQDFKNVLYVHDVNIEDNEELALQFSQNTTVVTESDSVNNSCIDIIRYSRLSKLQRVTAWVFRFINNIRKINTTKTGPLSVTELEHSTNFWIKQCQHTAFSEELANLKSASASRLPLVRQLRLYLSNGIIRCGGRIHNAPLSELARFPILLPANHHFTLLIVRDAHINMFHSGLNATLTHLRQKYWISAGRQYVKKLLRQCVICRKVNGPAYRAPDSAPLPAVRTEASWPFAVTGVDFTGALYVKSDNVERKAYICLFTCANTRAVHLEVVTDLSVDTFIESFRRFVSRKSLPRIMVSDNASTYHSAAETITQIFQSSVLVRELAKRGVEWRFIPKRAPWYGGFWERLTGLTKTVLKKILGRTKISLATLQTIITEVEAIINDRPLTYVSSELEDEQPLTLSDLLYGRITLLPHVKFNDDLLEDPNYCDNSTLNKRARVQAQIIQHFWARWRHEYLTSLREHHRGSGSNEQWISVGEIVQIHDDSKRVNWKLARIKSLIYGNDNLVRAANVRTANGFTNRPITKLYPLEVISSDVSDSISVQDITSKPDSIPVASRPRRQAAELGRLRISDWTKQLSSTD